ncbi:SDR family NAD(P)-dependent oxidoreductase [Maribacter litoralis]|uniref:SDR family NAD(P)-dependent oxidoreductase n=1 Tax=Maribacter litoralis TaxID=2059726 RepID=UPI000E31C585|nr:SDR family NAD(P)-dependent oxidoreductase [Maribacter litoralis]|tara:strand:- start:135 stop:884 length:750 start_codon:yes stop_codon:yes gene_type:complete
MKLKNKVVFITGGASGIGKASAIAAAKEGATVVIADLASSKYEETLVEIEFNKVQSLFVPIDVANVESVKKAIQTTVEKFGRLDVAFNNAGIAGSYSDIHDLEEEQWQHIIDVNLTGQFYCIKYELQQFLKQGGGIIVNMASIAGLKAENGLIPYTAAKHGMMGLTKNIAVQYGTQNIRANAICPYYIETPLLNDLPAELHSQWVNGTPMKRLGEAEEVAKAFIYLASDDSSYCNGTHILLDGGALARI